MDLFKIDSFDNLNIQEKRNCGICQSAALRCIKEFPKLPLSDTYTTLDD